MKNTKKIIIIFGMFLMILSNSEIFKSLTITDDYQIINNIADITKGKVMECGVGTSFYSNEVGGESFTKTLDSINGEKNFYSVDLKDDEYSGYIRRVKEEDIISVFLKKETNTNEIDDLIFKCNSMVKSEIEDKKYFKYIKVKLNNVNLYKLNNEIVKELQRNNCKNIDSIKIGNGFSITAYSGKYYPISTNGDMIDLNIAICSYDSGSYMIIGTPEIIISY